MAHQPTKAMQHCNPRPVGHLMHAQRRRHTPALPFGHLAHAQPSDSRKCSRRPPPPTLHGYVPRDTCSRAAPVGARRGRLRRPPPGAYSTAGRPPDACLPAARRPSSRTLVPCPSAEQGGKTATSIASCNNKVSQPKIASFLICGRL
jgi:hypothetical protein